MLKQIFNFLYELFEFFRKKRAAIKEREISQAVRDIKEGNDIENEVEAMRIDDIDSDLTKWVRDSAGDSDSSKRGS